MNKQLLNKIKNARSTSKLTTQNEYDEQHETSQLKDYYEKAETYMAGKSYLERRMVWYKLGKNFRSFYHPVSVTLALITAVLLATRHLDRESLGIITIVLLSLTLILLLIIFAALEWGKKEKATDVFYKWVHNKPVPMLQWIYLTLFVLASLVVSAVGGALIGDVQTNQTKAIASKKATAIRQVKATDQKRLQQLATIIAGLEAMSVNTKVRRWGLTKKEQANLETSRKEKAAIEQKQSGKIARIEASYQQQTQANNYYRNIGMGIGFFVVLLMELLTIYAYYFHSVFMKRVQTEGKQNEILLPNKSTMKDTPESTVDTQVTDAVTQGFKNGLVQITNLVNGSANEVSPDTKEEQPVPDTRQEISLRPGAKTVTEHSTNTAKTFEPPGRAHNSAKIQASGTDVKLPHQKTEVGHNSVQTLSEQSQNSVQLPVSDTNAITPATHNNTAKKKVKGYHIPQQCFDIYYNTTDKTKEPFYTLWRYEDLFKDLLAGISYGVMITRYYKVYNTKIKEYERKQVGRSTIRNTVVAKLKSLANSE